MPSSQPYLLSYVCGQIAALQPTSVLDIGIGFGKWGFLAREYTDVWSGRMSSEAWTTKIDGIEIHPLYISHLQKQFYNHIFVGDASELLVGMHECSYDLILCFDVIEHLHEAQGQQLLRHIRRVAHRQVFVSTPARMSSQGEVFGNGYEAHIHQWSKKALERYGRVDASFPNTLLLAVSKEVAE